MINEYLFLTDEHRATVEAYKPDGITVEIYGIEKTTLWVATYFLAGKNKDSAKKLSEVHATIIHYSPLVLSCESSEYYNRILFPLVNELERKLRKLLYLAASISDNEKAKESIKQLEEKDFGEIFDLLFVDQNFIRNMKKRINAEAKSEFNGRSKYSKDEIKSYLDSLVEHTLWDTILGRKDVPTLRYRFRDVQTYRNDVMHAHNIGKGLFAKARYLFDKTNKELDGAIGRLIGVSEEGPAEQKPEVNTAISSALAAMDLSTLSDVLKDASLSLASLEMSSQLSKLLKGLQPLGASTVLADAVKRIQLSTIQPTVAEVLRGLTPAIDSFAITEALKGMNALVNNSAIIEAIKGNSALAEALRGAIASQTSPAIESLRRQASQLSEAMRSHQQMFDALRTYNALHESLHSRTEGLPHSPSIDDEHNDTDEEETDSAKPEEGGPDERS